MTERASLATELTDWIADWASRGRDGLPPTAADEARFERVSLELFSYQYAHIPAYRRFCDAAGVTPNRVTDWRDVPRVPVTALKTTVLATDTAVQIAAAYFVTSGTSDGRPGRVWLEDTATYDQALAATFHAFCTADHFGRVEPESAIAPAPFRCVSLVPSGASRPHSSLAHMVERLFALWDDGKGGHFFGAAATADDSPGAAEGLDLDGLLACVGRAVAVRKPVFLFATSIALQILIDRWPTDLRLTLPAGSRLLDTGGPKGRLGPINRPAQHQTLGAMFGLDEDAIVGEFGMTELSSPRYETLLRARTIGDVAPLRAYAGAPWLRTLVIDPATGAPLPDGESGMLAHVDLANLDSVAFLLTADLGRIVPIVGAGDALELVGRVPGAEWRGCGLDVEEFR